jgi:hypothetical protein
VKYNSALQRVLKARWGSSSIVEADLKKHIIIIIIFFYIPDVGATRSSENVSNIQRYKSPHHQNNNFHSHCSEDQKAHALIPLRINTKNGPIKT